MLMKNKKIILFFFFWVSLFLFSLPADVAKNKNNPPSSGGPQRKKDLNFEDDIVEGMNHLPLDHLKQFADKDKKKEPHLYHKRNNFENEIKIKLKEWRYLQ